MKLFDKIKDLFLDEIPEEDRDMDTNAQEENSEKKVEPPVLPKVMRDTIDKEENNRHNDIEFKVRPEEFVNNMNEDRIRSQEKKNNLAADFLADVPSRTSKKVSPNVSSHNVNVLNMEKEEKRKELYPVKEEIKYKPKFKASPVISPVYGILDKNYKKEEVKERPDDNVIMKRPSKKVDFETVRKKAFGNLVDDIKDNLMCENCELYKEVKKISELKEDDLLYDMTVDTKEETVTIGDSYENYEEFGVAYEYPKREKKVYPQEDDDINKVLDEIVIDNKNDDTIDSYDKKDITEDILVKEVPEEVEEVKEKKKEDKVDADFFELIDSMYKERVDE